jgi:CHAD domain-containing protein
MQAIQWGTLPGLGKKREVWVLREKKEELPTLPPTDKRYQEHQSGGAGAT